MLLSANLRGISGLTDVGYRFYDASETAIGVRSQAGVIAGGDGWYSVDVDIPAGASWIRWDSLTQPKAKAREQLSGNQSLQLEAIQRRTDLISAGAITVLSPVAIEGNRITVRSGDSWEVPITGLGSLADAEKLWFAVKTATKDADAAAVLLVESVAGLTIVAGATYASPADGTLAIDDAGAGEVTISVNEAATVLTGSGEKKWALKVRRLDGSVATTVTGTLTLLPAIVRAIT